MFGSGIAREPFRDPFWTPIWAPKSAYFFTVAAQDGFQTVLRRLGRPSEGGPKLDPKMDRKKIGRESKTGQPAILKGGVQRPREGIKGWVNPFLWDWKGWESWMEEGS